MKTTLCALTLLVFQAADGFTQATSDGEQPVPPPGPLIQKRAPEFASWVISVRLPGDTAKKPNEQAGQNPEPKDQAKADAPKEGTPKFAVIKTGKIYHVRLVDAQKQTWDVWSDGSVTATVPAKGGDAAFVAPPGDRDSVNPLYVNFSKSDFSGFEWISASNYRGIKNVMGQQCLVFSDKVKIPSEPASNGDKSAPTTPDQFESKVACVNAETRLPVALTDASGISTYKFLTPPTAMQTLPASVVSLVQKQHELEQSLVRRPRKPF